MEIAGAAIQLARRTPGPSAHRRLLRWLRMSQRVSQGHERNRCTHHEKSHFHIPTLPCSRPARRFHNTIAPANKLIPPGNTRCMSWARNARPALEWRVRRSPDTGHGSGALDVRFLPIVAKSARCPLVEETPPSRDKFPRPTLVGNASAKTFRLKQIARGRGRRTNSLSRRRERSRTRPPAGCRGSHRAAPRSAQTALSFVPPCAGC